MSLASDCSLPYRRIPLILNFLSLPVDGVKCKSSMDRSYDILWITGILFEHHDLKQLEGDSMLLTSYSLSQREVGKEIQGRKLNEGTEAEVMGNCAHWLALHCWLGYFLKQPHPLARG